MKVFKRFEKGTKDCGFEKACKYLLEHLGYDCELTKDSGDDGVDIIATKDDIVIGIQCKNYDDKVSNDKIRDFNGALAIYNISNGIFMTTNTFTSEAIKTANKLGIDLWDYTKIKSESNKLGFDLETLEPIKEKKLKSVVFSHNVEVYEQMEKMLDETNKAILTMGTGIGKTTTALEYLIRHNCRALVVCPTNIVKDSWKNNKANKNDRLVDTTTYQSFSTTYQDIDYSEYGLVIFDEVHHAGAETWGSGVKYLIDNNIRVLGLTATEERTDGNNVAESLFEGNLVEGLDILGGIREGVVYPFTYVGALYNAEQVCQEAKEKYGDKLTELLLGEIDMALNNTKDARSIVKKDMPKGNRKGIIFSADIESMDNDIKFIQDIYPKAEIKRLHSNMTYNEQKEVKEWFANTKTGYICTVGMVNEGAHYEGVNTVFMLRKTSSELIFLQQLGRCITSTYGHKDPKTVVFDLVNSSKAIQNVKKKFKESGVENNITAIEVTEEEYQAITEAIESGVIEGIDTEDGLVEISVDDIPALEEETDIELNIEEPKRNVKQLTRTIYVKNNPTYNADYGKSKQIIVEDYTEPIEKVLEEIRLVYDMRPWSDDELQTLITGYPIKGIFVYKDIKTRTKSQCRAMASKLGLLAPDDLWDEDSDNIIKEYYPEEGSEIIKRLPNRTLKSIQSRAHILGVHINKKYIFTPDDDKLLIELYIEYGRNAFEMLPNKTKNACMSRAKELGLTKLTLVWTDIEKNVIAEYYPTEGGDVYKRLPGRTKGACQRMAKKMKIHSNIYNNKKVWSEENISLLKELYPKHGSKCYKYLSGITKEEVISKASELNLKYDNRCVWDNGEVTTLVENFPLIGLKVKEFLPNKSIEQIKRKAQNMGLKYQNTNRITEDEKDIIKEFYPLLGKDIVSKLPNRSLGVIQSVAQKLGVKYNGKPKGHIRQVLCVELKRTYYSCAEASRDTGINASNIIVCCKGKIKTAGGYHWKYVEE